MTEKETKATNSIDYVLTKYAASQRYIPTLIESSVSRRGFMRGAAITGLTFAMTPWEKALAAHRFPELEMIAGAPPPPTMAGFWDGVLQVGRILATLLGFGYQFQTIYNALGFVLEGNKARDNAKAALKSLQDEITQHAKDYILDLNFHELKEAIIDEFRKPLQTVFAGDSGTGMIGTRPRDMFSAHASPPQKARRLYVMTLPKSSLNSLVPIFDYGAHKSPYDARALVGLPTLQSFNRMLTRRCLAPYREELRNLIYPLVQSNRYRAYGVWEKTYKIQDRYETARGTTLEFNYEFKGPYTANNAAPKTVHGLLTTIIGGLPKGHICPELKFVDTYCWIPPLTTVKPCIG